MSEENKNSGDTTWDFDNEKKSPQKQTQQYTKADYDIFVKLKPQEKPFRVRIASNSKNFRSHWGAFKSISKAPVRSPAYAMDEKNLDIAWAEGDWFPQRRHACLVFDRDDGNKLKIMEAGDSVFVHFGNWLKENKINPSSNEATDWSIWVKSNGGTTEYSATPSMKPSPFTEEEKKILANPPFDINKVIKIKTSEEIKKMWLQLDDDKKYNPKSKFKAGNTFDKSDFEKRHGSVEDKPATLDPIISQEEKDRQLKEVAARQEQKSKAKEEPDQDNLPF